MKKIIFSLLACSFMFTALTSCTSPYDPAPQILPEHIKKVYVKPFINNTNQFGLETKFTNKVIEEMLSDGRLSLVNDEKEADGVLTAVIKRYILQPLTYDVNMVVDQYKMWVIVSVSFVDVDNNVTLWTEPNMEGIQVYKDLPNNPNNRMPHDEMTDNTMIGEGMTEEDAREIIWEKLARNIVKRTIKGFGSVTSISEKKVPN